MCQFIKNKQISTKHFIIKCHHGKCKTSLKAASSDDRALVRTHVLAKFEAVNITSVGGVQSYARCGKKVTIPTSSRWCYRRVSVCAYVCSQGRVPGKPMKFGEDRTMYGEAISDLFGHQ